MIGKLIKLIIIIAVCYGIYSWLQSADFGKINENATETIKQEKIIDKVIKTREQRYNDVEKASEGI